MHGSLRTLHQRGGNGVPAEDVGAMPLVVLLLPPLQVLLHAGGAASWHRDPLCRMQLAGAPQNIYHGGMVDTDVSSVVMHGLPKRSQPVLRSFDCEKIQC